MQKQKINYLALQSTYSSVDLALFENQQCISFVQISKFTASSELIPAVKTSLAEHSMPLRELDFICANLGPAPFTTLRTTIVTVNGLGFATQIPLVGVNGLEAFAKTVPMTPNQYRRTTDGDLNEWRIAAGISPKRIHEVQDDVRALQSIAGLI